MGKSLKGKELGRGITQRKDGTYQARFINRFGKRQTIYGKTVTEITKRLRDEQYENEKQINVVNDKMTVDEWFEIWITTCKAHCRNTTKRTYTIQYNRLREKLGWRRLTKLNLVSLQEAFNELATDKMRRDCKALLSDMFKRAIENELMVKNIAIGINTIIENKESEEKRILSDEEIKILLDSSKSGQMYAFYVIALETGMRMGDADGKISLNQQKPSKHAGLRRFGPEKFLQRNNEFMKERPIFYKKPIKTEKDFSTWLRCFYYTTKAVITEYIYF